MRPLFFWLTGMKGMKILFVDDDADTSWTFSELAKLMGHEAVSATTGAQALDEARRHLPDLIFLDVLLGKDDGREVCALLRCEPTLSQCAIFAVTGLPHAHAICDPKLFDGVLLKPVTIQLLEEAINHRSVLQPVQTREPEVR
jgi:CheY-like chemotaxis protein